MVGDEPLMGPIRYANPAVPEGYRCTGCGKSGGKLWRQYQTVASAIKLLCCDCAIKDQGPSYQVEDIDANGKSTNDGCKSDAIGWLVPAVPTEDGETFWGYTSVPEAGVAWWRALPTRTT